MKRLEGRTVVTGGNEGIGFAIAERCGLEDANLVIAPVEAQVDAAAAKLRETGRPGGAGVLVTTSGRELR